MENNLREQGYHGVWVVGESVYWANELDAELSSARGSRPRARSSRRAIAAALDALWTLQAASDIVLHLLNTFQPSNSGPERIVDWSREGRLDTLET